MEDLWETWISSLEMDCDSLDDDKFHLENVQQPSFSFEGSNNAKSSIHENINNSSPLISQEYYDPNSQKTPSQYLLSFENSSVEPSPNSAIAICSSSIMDNETSELPKVMKQRSKNRRRSSSEIQDHIMAERKRRQVIGERFIALSATIPGLKKTDKVYILEEAVNYVKQLQENIRELENQNKMKKRDSVIQISQACTKGNDNDEHKYFFKKELPKVKARVMDKEIMIGIYCEKQKGIIVKLMALLQNLHLSLASTTILPFGFSTLKVTIIAQMNDGFCMSVNDVVKHLMHDLFKSGDNQNNM